MSEPAGEPARPRVSVVLPVYKTAQFVRELHERCVKTFEKDGTTFELLMIDDGSPDGAWAILGEIAARDPRVKAIRFSRNFGQHPAIAAGFEHARGEAVVLMDTDLQDRPEDIPLLLGRLGDAADIVYTVKAGEAEPFLTRLTSRIFHTTFAHLSGTAVPENIGTFRAFTRRVLEAALSYPERSVLYGPLMFHMGFEHTFVPVAHDARREGKSAYSFRKRLLLAIDALVKYTDLPHRVLIALGTTIVAGSVLYTIALLARWALFRGALPPGLTLLALLMTATLGSMTLGIGIVGVYVFRVYQEVLARPRYIISRSLNV